MTDERKSIELQVEVAGTPEEVWRAIATGPGISSWYVPHTVEEHEGGTATASFGPGPEMQVPGRVAAWEPPNRIVFDGGDETLGLAFEWLVEAKVGSTCIVRLVNTGFGSGGPWDDQYDAMSEGWQLFLLNLRLHLEHFPGQSASSMLPTALWTGTREAAWAKLKRALGISASPAIGSLVRLGAADSPSLVGTIADAASWRLALIVEHPAPGTAIVAAEGTGDQSGVSVWSYLYGDEGRTAVERDEPLWSAWLQANAS